MSIIYLITSLTHCLFDIEGSNKSHCVIKLKMPIGSQISATFLIIKKHT